MKVAVIGRGNVGAALAKRWIAAGHEVVLGVRTVNAADSKPVAEAAENADVVVLAVPWPAVEATVRECGNLEGKILIDCTNPLKPDLSGLTVGTDNSAGEEVQRWAVGASVFKAFNTTGSKNMESQAGYPAPPTMYYAGNDNAKKPFVETLIKDAGFNPIHAGGIHISRYLEPFALLWIHMAVFQKAGPDFVFQTVKRSHD